MSLRYSDKLGRWVEFEGELMVGCNELIEILKSQEDGLKHAFAKFDATLSMLIERVHSVKENLK
jgi:hypothetical protein